MTTANPHAYVLPAGRNQRARRYCAECRRCDASALPGHAMAADASGNRPPSSQRAQGHSGHSTTSQKNRLGGLNHQAGERFIYQHIGSNRTWAN